MALLCFVLIWIPQEPVQETQWTHVRKEWKQKLTGPGPVMVVNEFGDIRVRTVETDQLTVIANIQKRLSTKGSAQVIRRADDNGMAIEVHFPASETPPSEPQPASTKKRRVDLTILIPAETPLSLKTGDGLVEAKSLLNEATVETRLGDIHLVTSGPVTIKTRQGKVKTFFKATDWDSPSSIQSIHGEVSVFLPEKAGLSLTAVTAGLITTDYSIKIKHLPEKRKKSASLRVGDGKRHMEIRSQQAHIKLLRIDP